MKDKFRENLDRISSGGDHTGSDPGSVFSDRDSRKSRSVVPSAAGTSPCAGSDRWNHRYQCICRTLTGIASGALIMLLGGHTIPTDLLANMGSGVSGV